MTEPNEHWKQAISETTKQLQTAELNPTISQPKNSLKLVETTASIVKNGADLEADSKSPRAEFSAEIVRTKADHMGNYIDRPKAIFITSENTIDELANQLTTVLGSCNFHSSSAQSGIYVSCKNNITRQKLVEFLGSINQEYYSYQPLHERGFRIFIKNLNKSTPLDWTRNEFLKLGYKVRFITAVKLPHSGAYANSFKAELVSSTNIKDVLKINMLGNQHVKIERQIRCLEVPQCFRCQQLGHTINYCARHFTCVKCAGKHSSTNCPMSRDCKPTCANCAGDHPANYRGCIAYQNALKARNCKQYPMPDEHPLNA